MSWGARSGAAGHTAESLQRHYGWYMAEARTLRGRVKLARPRVAVRGKEGQYWICSHHRSRGSRRGCLFPDPRGLALTLVGRGGLGDQPVWTCGSREHSWEGGEGC